MRIRKPSIVAAVILTRALVLAADTPSTTAPGSTDMTLVMNPFEVNTNAAGKYEMSEATSGGRVATSLFDSSNSIGVISNQFLQDIDAGQAIDALKYISGITQSTQPIGADRIQVRGFQQSNFRVMDGFLTASGSHLDPAFIDHIEVVKGPDSIISPSGQPGGTVNYSVKKPEFRDFGHFTVQAGQYDSNRVEFDYNRKINDTVAVRVDGGGNRDDGYYHDWNHSWMVSPSVAFQLNATNKIDLYAIFDNHLQQAYQGVAIDPADGSNTGLSVYPGLARNANYFNDQDSIRHETRQDYFLLYTGQITDNFSVRVAAHALWDDEWFRQFQLAYAGGTPTNGGSANPYTGVYEPGVNWSVVNGTPVSTPAVLPYGGVFHVSGADGFQPNTSQDFQNDYVYHFKIGEISSQTIAGFSYNRALFANISHAITKPDVNAYGPNIYSPYAPQPNPPISNNVVGLTSIDQVYAMENLELFNKKVVFNLGGSDNTYHANLKNNLNGVVTEETYNEVYPDTGVVLEPLKSVAFYYKYSQNAYLPIGNGLQDATSYGTAVNGVVVSNNPTIPDPYARAKALTLEPAKQQEVGARYRFPENIGTFSVDYFSVTQENLTFPNPANLNFPPPNPTLPPVIANVVSHGLEFDTTLDLTKELSLMANFTTFKAHDVNGSPLRGTAQKSGAAWAQYDFRKGSLNGFGIGVGVSYMSKRAGDSVQGFTAYSIQQNAISGSKLVINQPTFWLPSYWLMDASVSYKFDRHWSARVFVNNVTDTKYFAGALSRTSVYVGAPANAKVSATYTF